MLGFAEPDARKWVAAVMRRSRNRAAEHDQVARRMATAVHDELSPLTPQAEARWGDERQALEPDAKSREFREREDGVSRAVRAAGGLAGLPSRDSAALENYAVLMRHWQAAALASIDKRDLGLCLGAALCLGVAAGLIVSTMENASFEPYFVGLFVAIAVCSRVFLKETEGPERKEAYPDPRQTPPARRTNGMYQPGESGNPHDRPISAPGPFSQPFHFRSCGGWELHGETALARTAVEYPDRFVAICSHLLPRDVMLAIDIGFLAASTPLTSRY
jgi:hypothetical protein